MATAIERLQQQRQRQLQTQRQTARQRQQMLLRGQKPEPKKATKTISQKTKKVELTPEQKKALEKKEEAEKYISNLEKNIQTIQKKIDKIQEEKGYAPWEYTPTPETRRLANKIQGLKKDIIDAKVFVQRGYSKKQLQDIISAQQKRREVLRAESISRADRLRQQKERQQFGIFTGTVDVFSKTGEPQKRQYFQEGKKVGVADIEFKRREPSVEIKDISPDFAGVGGAEEVLSTGEKQDKTITITPQDIAGTYSYSGRNIPNINVSIMSDTTGIGGQGKKDVDIPKSIGLVPEDFTKLETQVQAKKDTSYSFDDALMQSGRNIFYNIDEAFGNKYGDKDKDYKNIFAPFKRIGKTKAEKPVFFEPNFGSIQAGGTGFTEVTFGDIEVSQRTNKALRVSAVRKQAKTKLDKKFDELQAKVNKRNIGVDKANEQLDKAIQEVNKELQNKVQKIEKQYPGQPDILEQTGVIVPKAISITTDVGAGLAGVIHPGIPVAYFTTKGAYQIAQGSKKDILRVDSGAGGQALTGYLDTAEKSPQTKAGEINLAIGALSGFGLVRAGNQAITKADIEALKKIPFKVSQKQIVKQGNRRLLKVSASKAGINTAAEGDILIPVKQLKSGKFVLGTGKGKITLRAIDYNKFNAAKPGSGILRTTETFTVRAQGNTRSVFIRTPAGNIFLTEDQLFSSTGFGDIAITGQDTITPFSFASVGKRTGTGFQFGGGEIKKIDIFKSGRVIGKFRPEFFGDYTDDVSKSFSNVIKGSGKKSSKQFLDDLYKSVSSTGKTAGKKTGKVITKSAGKNIQKNIQKAVLTQDKTASNIILGKVQKTAAGTLTKKAGLTTAQKVSQVLGTSAAVGIKQAIVPRQKSFQESLQGLGSVTSQNILETQTDKTKPDGRAGTITGTGVLSSQIQKPKLKTSQVTEQVTSPVITPISTPTLTPGFDIPKPKPRPPGFRFDFGFERKGKPSISRQPHDVFVKSRGKFRKITKKPVKNRAAALDLGSFTTDRTLARTYKVKPSKKQPAKEPQFKVPAQYNTLFGYKFRGFQQRKGRRQPLRNKFIEKKSYIGDTSSELRRLQVSKFLAQQKKQTQVRNKRNKKAGNIGFGMLRGF